MLESLRYKNKIRVLFIPVFLVIAIGLFSSYELFLSNIQQEHHERLMRTAQLTENNLKLTQKELMKLVQLFQKNRTLTEYLYISTILGGDSEPLGDILRPIYNSLEIDSIQLYDSRGHMVFELDNKEGPSHADHGSRNLTDSVAYGYLNSHGHIEMAAIGPLLGSDKPGGQIKTVGYVSVGKYIDKKYLSTLREISGSEVMVRLGSQIAASSSDRASASFTPAVEKVVIQDIPYSFTLIPVRSINGKFLGDLVVAISDADLLAAINKLKVSIIVLFLAAVAVFWGIAWLFMNTLESPLNRIVDFIGTISQGKFGESLAVRGRDEIAVVSKQLNEMQEQLRSSRELALRYTESLEQAVAERTRQLDNVQKQLLHSQKLDAVGQLAGGIAHDFNNLLSVIIGYAELASGDVTAEDPHRGYLDQITQAAAKAAQLTGRLLTFSRQQIIDPKPVDVNDTVQHMHRILERLIREDIQLIIDMAKEPLIVFADKGQLEQVLLNLVANARDALPDGGKIILGTEVVGVNDFILKNAGCPSEGEYVKLSVTDTGAGMDDVTKERIFEPFFTTKEPGKGTGLGLSIVYGIITRHNGCVHVESTKGEGSTFTVYLPRLHRQPDKDIKETMSHSLNGSETIILAEDDDLLRRMFNHALTKSGYTVLEVSNGQEAVNVAGNGAIPIELFLSDMIMPVMNGREALDEIRKIRPGIKTIFLSGYSGDMIDQSLIGQDKTVFLMKPITPGALLKTVRDLLDDNSSSPSIIPPGTI